MKVSKPISLKLEEEAIRNCENEVIHNIGYIQSFGFLFAIDPKDFRITHVSENLSDWFNQPINEILGAPLNKLVGKEIIHQCNNALAHSTISTQREYVGRIQKGEAFCEVFVHLKQERFIFELQPNYEPKPLNIKLLDRVQNVLGRLRKLPDVQSLVEQAVDELRFITGFHRVKAYKFLSDGAGEVIAESKVDKVDSFLGLRFPAFDIPKAARKLYTTTPIRLIPSVSSTQIPILSLNPNSDALDLSLAILRGNVPVHTQYLQNMGVKATLSLPIVINGKMWGLFAFHHEDERLLNSEILTSLEILGSTIAMTIKSYTQKKQLDSINNCTKVASVLFVQDESPIGFSTYWDAAKNELATLIDSQGVSLVGKDQIYTYGTCPDNKSIRSLVDKLNSDYLTADKESKPIALESISAKYPNLDCGEISGVLAIPNPAAPYQFLFYFRMSTHKTVRWAGNPKKDLEKTYSGVRLNPRASFAEYINPKQKQSDKFSDEEIIIGESIKDALLKTTSNSVIQSEHRRRLGLVIRELNHRVRNTLALVSSIISQTSSSSHSLEEYIRNLEIRIQSLSETQKLLTEFEWQEVGIQKLFERSLAPYKEQLEKRIILNGENVNLEPALASLLSLIISELSLNATKHGALKNVHGNISLSWVTTDDNIIISWIESGGPEVKQPTRTGFGSSLIKEALTYEFNAECSLDFLKKGIEAKFIIPFKEKRAAIEYATPKTLPKSKENKSFKALILEDDYVVSRKLVALLKELGAVKIDAASNLKTMARYIAENEYDIAFLDFNIRGEYSTGISTLLIEKNIPFAFITGYGNKDEELNKIDSLAILSKPVNKEELKGLLHLAKLR